eukprot:7338560-Lingulodinium_polyedra.AAC.1
MQPLGAWVCLGFLGVALEMLRICYGENAQRRRRAWERVLKHAPQFRHGPETSRGACFERGLFHSRGTRAGRVAEC